MTTNELIAELRYYAKDRKAPACVEHAADHLEKLQRRLAALHLLICGDIDQDGE